MLAAWPGLMEGFHGVSTEQRGQASCEDQTTLLPGIHVDFRDIAEEVTSPPLTSPAALTARSTSWCTGAESRFDFDNDGLPDVFLVNGTTLDGKGPGEKSTSHLYRNLGKLRFEDVTEPAPAHRGGDRRLRRRL